METLLLYVLKSTVVLGLFYAAYQLLLKKETFFSANRVFLLSGIVTAALMPLAVFTKTVWVEAQPEQTLSAADMALLMQAMKNQTAAQPEAAYNWLYAIIAVYCLGLLFFGIKLLADVYRVRKMLKGKSLVQQERYKLVDSDDIAAPFSFFNYIVYNSTALQPQELESIISHEKVHSRQKHSLDMLIAQAYCIIFWFNPVAWLYRKAISQNLEFIADAEAAIQVADRTAYQKTMLRLSVQPQQIAIINHFYQSLIKKRIVMLNKQRSHRYNSWKFAAVLPLLAAFMMAFQVQTVKREKTNPKNQSVEALAYEDEVLVVEITKNTDDAALKKTIEDLKNYGAIANFTNVQRNDKGEITAIRLDVKAGEITKLYDVESSEAITSVNIMVQKEGGKITDILISPAKAGKHIITDTDSISPRISKTAKVAVIAAPAPPAAPAPLAPLAPLSASGNGQNIAMNLSDNTIVIVNGQKLPKGAPVTLPQGQQISSVNVLKGKEAKKKYGKEAKDGAIEITTYRATKGNAMVVRPNNGLFAFTMDDYNGPTVAEGNFSFSPDDMPAFDFQELNDENGMQMRIFADKVKAFADMNKDMLKDFNIQADVILDLDNIDEEALQNSKFIIQKRLQHLDGSKMRSEDMEKMRAEMEKAKAEMMKARQEMMKAREEFIKDRKEAIEKAKKANVTRKA